MQLPTLRQMQYLLALEKHKNFNRAADSCFVTQSTLSAGIKELENILGQPLIDRSKRKVLFTPLGRLVLEDSHAILTRAEKILERTQSFAKPMSGPLRLGVIPTIAPFLLPSLLPRAQKKFPNLDLQLHEDLSHRLIEQLENGELDLVLMAFPFDTPNLQQEILFKEEFLLATPKDYDISRKDIKPDQLNPNELLLLQDGHCLSDHALSACKIQRPKQRNTYSATSLPTLLQMVENGYGITLVPKMAATAHALPPSIKLSAFKNPRPSRKIGLAWRPGSPRVRDFKTLGQLIKTPPEQIPSRQS